MLMWRDKSFVVFGALVFLAVACGNGNATKRDERRAPAAPATCTGESTLLASEQGAFALAYVWCSGPAVQDDNQLRLQIFSDRDRTAPQSIDGVTVKTWMPEMGHPGPRKMTIAPDAADPAVVNVSQMSLTMPGKWEVTIAATVNGISDKAVIAFAL